MTKFINTWQIHVLWLKCHSFTMLSQNALLYMTWKRNKTSLYLKTILVYHLIISLKLFIGLISLVFDNKIYTTIIFCVIVSKNMLPSDIPNFSAWSIHTINCSGGLCMKPGCHSGCPSVLCAECTFSLPEFISIEYVHLLTKKIKIK